MGIITSGHSCARSTKASAPAAHAAGMVRPRVASGGSKTMPSKRLASAVRGVLSVARPTTPIFTPARSTSRNGASRSAGGSPAPIFMFAAT
ncbi:MAG: hypothetical protein WKG00_35725 [Polyangiaceae bacterium]